MRHHESKLQRANVVAAFDSQQNADEALLELRSIGYRDQRIGYYYPAGDGRLVDLLANHHRYAATTIWGIVGGAAGVGAVLFLHRMGAAGPDPVGLAVTMGVCVGLFFGMAGGIMGLWTAPPGEETPAPADSDAPFVLAVEAGNAGDRVWEILRRRGGHELVHQASTTPLPGHLLA